MIRAFFRRFRTLSKGVLGGIPEKADSGHPIALFQQWFEDAKRSGLPLPESMGLATSTLEGKASVRMVLLKGVDPQGFVFFSNYQSRKAGEIEQNPRVALLFHWNTLQRQVRVEGVANRTELAESEAYFRTRSRNSCLGAWASKQSADLSSREFLEKRVRKYRDRFKMGEVPLPNFWGGYRVVPESIEFWQGRADRLHDRLLFRQEKAVWRSSRLYP